MAEATNFMKTTWEFSPYTTAKWMVNGTLKITRRKPDMFGRIRRSGYLIYVRPATCHAILNKRDEIESTMNDMMQQDDPEPTNIYLWGKFILQLSIFLKDGVECAYYGIHTLDEDQSVIEGRGLNLNQTEYDAFLKMLTKWRLYLQTSARMSNDFLPNDDARKKRKIKDAVQPKKNQCIVNGGNQTVPKVMKCTQNPDSDVVIAEKKQCTVKSDNQTVPEDMQDSQYPEGIFPNIDNQLDQFTDLLKTDNTYDDVIPPMELALAKKQSGKEEFTNTYDDVILPMELSSVKKQTSKQATKDQITSKLQTGEEIKKKSIMKEITDLMKEETEIMELMKKETEPMKEETEPDKVQVGVGADSKITKTIGITLYGWEWSLVKDDGSIEMVGKAQGEFFVDPKECVNQAMQNKPKHGKYKMNTITRKVNLPINHDLLDAALGRLVQLRQYHHKKLGMPEGHPSAESTILGSISFAEIYDLCRKAIQLYQTVTELDMSHLMELLSSYKKDYNIFYLLKNNYLNKYFVQLFDFLKW
jgi:hypothetical protein